MSSSSILMNLPAAAPAAPAALVAQAGAGAEQALSGTGGFDQALAAVQLGAAGIPRVPVAGSPSLEMIAALMAGNVAGDEAAPTGAVPIAAADPLATERTNTPDASAAAILAQMLLGSAPATPAGEPMDAAPDMPQATISAEPAVHGAAPARGGVSAQAGDPPKGDAVPADAAAQDVSLASLAEVAPEAGPDTGAAAGSPPAITAPQSSSASQVLVQAATVLRETAPAPSPNVPPHALREPVGTARWADELGNRLVLMSVRGQQQGSLTLTPEHLGPVEVQISVNKDTANVWFGAAHADTRVALNEAMPRLRELLAASGLSLGQSGVSEQAPREAFAPPVPQAGGAASAADAQAAAEVTPPAWRAWRPGLLDTYA